jgi:hypothetical protein
MSMKRRAAKAGYALPWGVVSILVTASSAIPAVAAADPD